MRKYIKWLVLFLILSIIVVFIISIAQKPPIEIISNARINLSKTEKLKASKYTGALYQNAKLYFDSAMTYWNIENQKIFFNRDYKRVESYANQSNIYSLRAIEQSGNQVVKMQNNIEFRISKLKQQIDELNKKFGNFPFNELNTQKLSNCKQRLHEAILSFKQSELIVAYEKLDAAELMIQELTENYENLLKDYFTNYPKWKKLIDKTILISKKNQTQCIIIDKYRRECLLYSKGVLKKRYTIELGTNWIGNKNHQGDKSTPEGYYRIIGKKKNGETKYYKAFLLDYPNEDDKKRFISNKKDGTISKDASIGNMIEIHGNGGKGVDWTDGCIALTDSDMDDLFKICNIGNVITIVGSVKPLDEIYNSL